MLFGWGVDSRRQERKQRNRRLVQLCGGHDGGLEGVSRDKLSRYSGRLAVGQDVDIREEDQIYDFKISGPKKR